MKDEANRPDTGPDKQELEAEARRIRREKLTSGSVRKGDYGVVSPVKRGFLRKLLYVSLSFLALLLAALLLAVPGIREGFSERMAGLFVPDPENQLYELPAPPPRAPNVTEQFEVPPDSMDDEILYSGPQQPEEIEPFSEEQEMVNLPRSSGSRDAFAIVEESEGPAGRLVRGEVEGREFKTWNLVSQNPPEYLLDIIAVLPGEEREQHLIFNVDVSSGDIEAMSQAARDLMRR